MNRPRRLINSFSGTLTAVILAFLLISILVLSLYWYLGERSDVEEHFVSQQNLTKEMLYQSVIWIDRGAVLYEMAFESELKEAMAQYIQAYNETGGDVSRLNLASLKASFIREFHGDWDLYLIDTGVVTDTTFPADKNLDFKKYPSLYQKYTGYIQNGSPVMDRAVRGFAPGAPVRKFIYQGTPDHRYLLEISRNFQIFYPEGSKTSYRELVNTTLQFNPYMYSMELYNSQFQVIGNRSLGEETLSSGSDTKAQVKRTFSQKNESIRILPEQHQVEQYLYLPVEDNGAPSISMMHLVARIVYSTRLQERLNTQLTTMFISLIGITLLLAFLIAHVVSRHLTRPLNQIGNDVDRIASGDLDHQITQTGALETQRIEHSITIMVKNLKGNIESLRLHQEELNKELLMRKKAEERYRRLFDSAHEAIFILEGGKVRDCNIAGCTLLGRNREDIIGRKLTDFSPDRNEWSANTYYFERNVQNPDLHLDEYVFSTEWEFIRPDHSLIETEVHINTINLGDEKINLLMVRDVSELREMSRRELRAITQIEKNLGQLATINDQIRNPLAIIMTLVEAEEGENASLICDQIKRIDDLIAEVDRGFVTTDKVRMYLLKHYEIGSGVERNRSNMNEEK